jgi:hypothetical protein
MQLIVRRESIYTYIQANERRVMTTGLALGGIGAVLYGAAVFGVTLGAVQVVVAGVCALVGLVVAYIPLLIRDEVPRRDIDDGKYAPGTDDPPHDAPDLSGGEGL